METCASAGLCNSEAGACSEQVCVPSTTTCSARDVLLVCNMEGTDFLSEESCDEGLCDAQQGKCNTCVPSSAYCDGDTAVRCSEDGTREDHQSCTVRDGTCSTLTYLEGQCVEGLKPSGARCLTGVCRNDGTCVECVPDERCASQQRTCEDHRCVPACGNSRVDTALGESCDPADPAFVTHTDLCDEACHVEPEIWEVRCATPGQPAWSGSGAANWYCNGTHTTSRFCETGGDSVCPGAECIAYVNANGQQLRVCSVSCTAGPAEEPPVQGGCPGSMICFRIPGQQGHEDIGTCGYTLEPGN